jgi:hypothetical protein
VVVAVGQPTPAPLQLRQVQVANRAVYTLLAVPRDLVCCWLRGSGCGGLYIRPCWTASTGETVVRRRFALVWLHGKMGTSPKA